MRIRRIIFENFRAFYGNHQIEFSYEDNSVNLIVAENEVGKTSILNALLWCLYDKFTDNTDHENIILNKFAKKQGERKARVIIELIDDIDYQKSDPDFIQISRTHVFGKPNNTLNVHKIDGITGETIANMTDPREFINDFCPEAISQYFFFDGEGIQKIATNQTLLKQAIRDIQGLNSAQGAINDLNKAYDKRLALFNKANKNNAELVALNKAKEKLELKVNELSKLNIDIAQEKSDLEREKAQANRLIGELGKDVVTEAQTKIAALEKNIQNSKKRLKIWEIKQEKFVGKRALAITSYHHMDSITAFMATKKETGDLPSGYEEVFVTKTLRKRICICGEPFKKDDKRYKAIEAMLSEARTQELDNKIFSIDAAFNAYVKEIESFNEERNEIDTQIHHFSSEIDKDKDALKEQKQLLIDSDEKAIAKAADKIQKIEQKLHGLITRSTRNEHSLKDLNNKLAENIRRRKAIATGTQFVASEEAELEFLEETIKYLDNLIIEQEIQGKARITELMNQYLRRFARGNNTFAFRGDSYSPVVLDAGVEEVDTDNIEIDDIAILSTGGAAVKRNLFFTTSLTTLSKERKDDKDNYSIPGSVAPMVVDAPFSNLDTTNTTNLSKLLVGNADQLIIMISSSAYNNGFADVMNKKEHKKQLKSFHYLTRQYIGKNEGENKDEKRKNETPIEINNKVIQTSFYENSIETSNIVKVK